MTDSARSLVARGALWFVLLPGLLAGYIPWRFFGLGEVSFSAARVGHVAGGLLVAIGAALLFWCLVDFGRHGRGTLSPLDPPSRLVVRGLYRHVRNPMYLSVALVFAGELLLAPSTGFLIYAGAWFVWVNLFVRGYEEPALSRQFGDEYAAYRAAVGRWVPRWSPWSPPDPSSHPVAES